MKPGRYHYVLTLQSNTPKGVRISTKAATFTVTVARMARQSIFHTVFNATCQEFGVDPNSSFVMFWSLDEN